MTRMMQRNLLKDSHVAQGSLAVEWNRLHMLRICGIQYTLLYYSLTPIDDTSVVYCKLRH